MEKAKIARPNSFRDVLLRVVLCDGAMIYYLFQVSCFVALLLIVLLIFARERTMRTDLVSSSIH